MIKLISSQKNIFLMFLLMITIVGGFLRIYKNTQIPISLNGDEISMAYDSYSISKTGRDMYNRFLPLTFESVGDYKNPVPVYLMVIPIKLFGFNEFSVRFNNLLFGTLMIPLLFLFFKYIFKDRLLALVGASFLAFSAWQIFYSRFEYEYVIASFFVLLGIWSLIKMFEGGRKWAFIAAFFLILTMYTAPATRLFVPVFILAILVFYQAKLRKEWKTSLVFIICCFILIIPLVYATLFLGAGTRLSMVLISNDIEFNRYIAIDNFGSLGNWPMLIFFWLKRFLNYLQPDFIFFSGLNLTQPGTLGLGMLYPFEFPWLILGVLEFIKRKIPYKAIFVIWLLTGIFPDSITNNQQHAGRLLHIAPVVILFTSLGAIAFFRWIIKLKSIWLKRLVTVGYLFFMVIVFIHAFLVITVHNPWDKGESIDEGLKEVALYINQHKDEYQQIVVDPKRGVDGPYQISNPYLYVLFYSKYDPQKYQTEPKLYGDKDNPDYRFDKYEIRNIDWRSDRYKKGTLFIGSPWSFPDEGVKPGELLQKVYLSNGRVAFYIVTPR